MSSDLYTSFPVSFVGVSVDATAVLLRYTLSGDSDLDKTVDTTDFNRLAKNFATSGDWSSGDFNYDDTVDAIDFNLLASNFGQTLPSQPVVPAVLPEPAL